MISDEIIERIANEVIRELERSGSSAPVAVRSTGSSAGAGCRKLVVAAGDATDLLKKFAVGGHAVVCTPGLESDAKSLGFSEIHTDANLWDFSKILAGVEEVVIPNIPLTLLSKIVNFISDSSAAGVVLAAIERNIPVSATLDMARTATNPAVAARLLDLRKTAESMGIRFTDGADLRVDSATCALVTPCATPLHGVEEGEVCGACWVQDPKGIQDFLEAGATRFGTQLGQTVTEPGLAQYIDHTMLKAQTTKPEIEQLCKEAREYKFASVCVNPFWVPLCASLLKGSGVKVCTVIGFPLGATSTAAKVAETQDAIRNGAEEVDMVIIVGALKAGDQDAVRKDVAAVKQAAANRILKVILETGLLTDEEKMIACQLCKEAGADFVKTSTGFGPGGATLSDIALMRRVVGPGMGVKASGGVKDTKTAQQMIAMGATRIGASAGIAIVKGEEAKGSGY